MCTGRENVGPVLGGCRHRKQGFTRANSEGDCMIVSIEIMQGRKWVKRAMLKTIHLKPVTDELSDDTFSRLLMAGHSPIRQFRVWVDLDKLEERVHTHFVRHRGADFSVGSFREDWLKELGLNLDDFRDGNGVWLRNMGFAVGSDVLMHMARNRLCTCAWSGTQQAMEEIRKEMVLVDPVLASYLLRPCVWCGFCPETTKYCGYMETPKYERERNWIVSESIRLRTRKIK